MTQHAPKRYSEGGALLSDPSSSEEASPDAVTSSLGGEPNLHREASAANGASDSATCNTIISAVVASDDGERGEKTNSVDGLAGTRAEDRELPARAVVQNSTESTHEPNPASDNLEPSGTSEAAAEALAEARNELATAKGLVSTLEKALDESRSEINALREEVVRSKSAADQQARDMVLLRYSLAQRPFLGSYLSRYAPSQGRVGLRVDVQYDGVRFARKPFSPLQTARERLQKHRAPCALFSSYPRTEKSMVELIVEIGGEHGTRAKTAWFLKWC